jgi:hypothetical protein
MDERHELVIGDVYHEWQKAAAKNPPMHSHHEAYAVILEELEEYWAEVMKRPGKRDPEGLKAELVQVAAMAMRALSDLCGYR